MTRGRISYPVWAIVFTLFSFAVSNVGLSAIIEYSVPMLMLIYPPAIALIVLAFIGRFFDHDRAVYICVMIGSGAAETLDGLKTLPAALQQGLHLDALVAFCKQNLPLFSQNLFWLIPAVIGFIVGMLIHLKKRSNA